MPSKDEILAQIKALQDEADAMGEEDEFDVEIWNEKGEGARLPHGATTRWLKNKFPELFDPDPDPDPDNNEPDDGKPNPPKRGNRTTSKVAPPNSSTRTSSTAAKYFGKRPAGK